MSRPMRKSCTLPVELLQLLASTGPEDASDEVFQSGNSSCTRGKRTREATNDKKIAIHLLFFFLVSKNAIILSKEYSPRNLSSSVSH